MDFSVINDFPAKGASIPKVVSIILAENGSLHHYPITKFLSSLDIKRAPFLTDFIEKEFGINQDDQLVLRSEDGKQLESSMNLEDFFQKDKTVYVYITKGQRQHVVQDEFEIIGAISLEKKWSESCMQFLPSIYENFLGSNMRDYLESEIVGTYDNLLLLFSDVKNELNFLREGMNKIGRQKDAEKIAKKNLLNYNNEKKSHFDEVLSIQEVRIGEFQQHIDKFDSYIEKLSKQEVDPQLGEENVRYLIDYFDMEKLKKSKGLAEKNQAKIKERSSELKEEIEAYDKQLKNIEDVLIDHSTELQTALQGQEDLFASIQDINLKEFRGMVESTKGNPSQIDLTNFELVKKENESTIPKLKLILNSLKEVKEKLEAYLKENSYKLKALVSDIKDIKNLIKGKIYNKLKVFCALVAKHEEGILNLEIVEKFPNVYQQSLNEIKRRIIFKKDYLTMLGILESFGSAENRCRHEFLEAYQHYLPKTFCPFLSKAFPHIRVSNIKKVVDQDLNLSFSDAAQSFIRPSSEADILKLLKNLNDNLETKDNKNRKLEDAIQSLKNENENLQEQLREKVLNVNNFRKLLGATGFIDKMEGFLGSYQTSLLEKVDSMEKRVQEIQDKRIYSLQNMISSLEQVSSKKEAEYMTKIKEFEQAKEDNKEKLNALDLLVQEKEKAADAKCAELHKIRQHLEEIKKESIGLKEEKALKEKEIARLTDQIKKYEKKEADSEQSKEKIVEELKKEIKEAEEEINLKEKELSKNQQIIAELNMDKETLTRQLQEIRSSADNTLCDKQKLQERIKKLEGEHETLQDIVRKYSEVSKAKDQDIKAKEKEIELLKHNLEQIKKEKEKQAMEAKASLEEKTSTQDQLKKKIEALDISLTSKNEEIAKLKNCLEQKIAEIKDKGEYLTQKELELVSLRHLIEAKQSDIDNLNKTIGADLNRTLLEPTGSMLSEIGNEILNLYLTTFGKQALEKFQSGERELTEYLQEISKFICRSMAKIEEFGVGDRVIGTRLDESNFVVVKKGMGDIHIFDIYRDEAKKFKDAETIAGIIKTVGDYQPDTILKKYDAVSVIDLTEVETLLPTELFKRGKK